MGVKENEEVVCFFVVLILSVWLLLLYGAGSRDRSDRRGWLVVVDYSVDGTVETDFCFISNESGSSFPFLLQSVIIYYKSFLGLILMEFD